MIKENFKILVLDGGGSKGVYSLGILKELESQLESNLCNHFDLIYGTSTGSIIGSLLALDYSVDDIKKLYLEYVPKIMSEKSKEGKSKRLNELGEQVYKQTTFNDLKTEIGIVALNYETQNPLIFKSNINQAHGMKQSFVPGFGCSISDAVQASCSAYPIFNVKDLKTNNYGKIKAIDGGFIANNATLFALIDADKAFKIPKNNIRVLSIGTGNYIEKPVKGLLSFLKRFEIVKVIERIITASTNTNVIMTKLLYKDINLVRVNNTYNEPQYGTNMVEKEIAKLEKLFQLGQNSYANQEDEIVDLMKAKSQSITHDDDGITPAS